MKKIVFILSFLTLVVISHSQEMPDVVYLKNGSIVKGLIVEQIPNEYLKIKTSDGSIIVYQFADISTMTKETDEINLDEYGSNFSFGVAIGGGGIIGCPLQVHPNSKFALEVGAFYRPTVNFDNGQQAGGLMLAGGPIIYFSKAYYPEKKQKIKLHGLSVKAGSSFSDISETFVSCSWVYEQFKKKNKAYSFIFELGGGIFFLNTDLEGLTYSNGSTTQPALYWKIHWNFYSK